MSRSVRHLICLSILLLGGCEACIPPETNNFFANGLIGSACSASDPCNAGLECSNLSEAGYCTASCPPEESCPFGTVCGRVEQLDTTLCLQPWMLFKTSGGVGASCSDTDPCDGCLECLDDGSGATVCSRPCNPGAPCPDGSHCGTRPLQACLPDILGATSDGLGESCESDDDCGSKTRCVLNGAERICSKGCTVDGDCPSGFGCKSASFDTRCEADDENEIYFTGPALGRLCNGTSPCADGLDCISFGRLSYCTKSCRSASVCPSDSQCNDLPARFAAPQSAPETAKTVSSPQCLARRGELGSKCSDENDCPLGLECINQIPGGFCTVECSSTNPCPDELNAKCIKLSGNFGIVCLKPCTSSCDCREGTSCRRVGTSRSFVCFPKL
ncbi:MAG: hypothetical protein KC609_19680 [Myxococcales bacterium]|nr:hypothetical protein [Myxococcales bacterium]